MDFIWQEGFEKVTFFYDEKTNTRSIISVHNTNRGPALGGTRIYPYASMQDAVNDVLRLSRGMTYKAAVADLPLGGGKSVIWADPKTDKTPGMLKSHGRFVDELSGQYITAEDSGTSKEDIDLMRTVTDYVVGTSKEAGGSGDPSPHTARGTLVGMKACAEKILEKPLSDCTVAVQGVGNVGGHLVRFLSDMGAKLYITDVDEVRVKQLVEETGATATSLDGIFDVDCDIFSPNAMGAVLNDKTIDRLKCKLIAGAANNQLLDAKAGERLHNSGVFYAPDYVLNAGGLVSVCCEWFEFEEEKRDQFIDRIGETMLEIAQESAKSDTASYVIADKVAESRFKNYDKQ